MRTAERTVILGAAGGFGRLFAELLEGPELVGADIASGATLRDDACAPGPALLAAVRAADQLLLCLPERAALAALDRLLGELASDALLVDTLSVKTPVARRLADAREDIELLSLNPLFAPHVGLAGQNVAAVVLRGGPRAELLLGRLAAAGANVVRMSADEHDRAAAAVQVAAHAAILAYAGCLERLGADHSGFSTPPSRALRELVDRVLAGDPEVYRRIQADNPYAEAAREALAQALDEVGAAAADEVTFRALYARLRA